MIRYKTAAQLHAATGQQARPRSPRKAPRRLEADLLRQCLELLRLRGVMHWRENAGSGLRRGRGGRMVPVRSAPEGTADVILVLRPMGRMVGLEVKSPTGRLRPAQIAWRDRLLAEGGLFWCVRDVRELEALLKEQGIP